MRAWIAPRPQIHRVLVIGMLVLVAWVCGGVLAGKDIEAIRAVLILSGLVVVASAAFWFASRSDREGVALCAVLFAAFALKLLAVAFWFRAHLLADAQVYDKEGFHISHLLANGLWPPGLKPWGTEFIRLATGFVYTATGHTFSGAFILWAWLGLLGMLFFYKAFTTAFPRGDRRLYLLLVCFYPSLVLWTSYLGKDAPMLLCLGMAAYGAARLQQRVEFAGIGWLALGSAGVLLIRPHIGAILAAALAAFALTRPIRAGLLTPVIRLLELGCLLIIAVAVARVAANYAKLDSLSAEDVSSYIEQHQQQTARGTAFAAPNPLNPLGFAQSIPTILFRPFPWEASNATGFAAALEGLGLLALVVYRGRSVGRALLEATKNSYLLMTVVYVLAFIFLFSAISNFGIIVRERVQMLPFVFMWIAYRGHGMHARSA